MNSGETNTRDQRVVGAYRAASDTLDERPQAATRAAILAAAARAVDAQPQDAETGATARQTAQRTRVRPRFLGPSKGPLALVASFLVATVALVLASHTMQEQPAGTRALAAKVAPAQEKSVQAPEVLALTEKERGLRRDADDQRTASTQTRNADKLAAAPEPPKAPARAKQEAPAAGAPAAPAAPPANPVLEVAPLASSEESKPVSSPREQMTASAKRIDPTSAIAFTETPPPAQPAKDVAANQAASAARAEQRAAQPEADATAQGKLAKAKPVERTAAIAGDSVENDPARWMERIITLRDAGHDEDADRELARLRERYPQFKVPQNALPRTGTR